MNFKEYHSFTYSHLYITNSYKMSFQDPSLTQIQQYLQPSSDTLTTSVSSSSITSNGTTSTTTQQQQSEFIPHLFYSIYQITKDPNNSENQLETNTTVIKNKIKLCKKYIENDNNAKSLLSKTIEDWEYEIFQKNKQINKMDNLISDLNNQIDKIFDDDDIQME